MVELQLHTTQGSLRECGMGNLLQSIGHQETALTEDQSLKAIKFVQGEITWNQFLKDAFRYPAWTRGFIYWHKEDNSYSPFKPSLLNPHQPWRTLFVRDREGKTVLQNVWDETDRVKSTRKQTEANTESIDAIRILKDAWTGYEYFQTK